MMPLDLTFKDIGKFLKKNDANLIADIDTLLSFLMVLTAAAVAPPSAGLVAATSLFADLLSVKGEVSALGKRIIDRVTRKTDQGTLERQLRMAVAFIISRVIRRFSRLSKHSCQIWHKRPV